MIYHETSAIDNLLLTATSIFKYKKLTLRQIEKIFTNIRLSLAMFKNKDKIPTNLLCLLTYLRICELDIYEKITHKEYKVQELITEIETIFPQSIFDLSTKKNKIMNRSFYFTIALLLDSYRTTEFGKEGSLLTSQNENARLFSTVKFIFEPQLVDAIKWTESKQYILPLDSITTKINLFENLQT